MLYDTYWTQSMKICKLSQLKIGKLWHWQFKHGDIAYMSSCDMCQCVRFDDRVADSRTQRPQWRGPGRITIMSPPGYLHNARNVST